MAVADFHVCVRGILLVVEHVSKGPKLAFRYPATATSSLSADLLAKMMTPKAALRDDIFELTLGDAILVSCPTSIETVRGLGLRMFNIAFAVTRARGALFTQRPLLRMLAKKAARMLHYEERRCGYVSREVTSVLQAREDLAAAAPRRGGAAEEKRDTVAHAEDVRAQREVDLVLEQSSLANALRCLLHGVRAICADVAADGGAPIDVSERAVDMHGWLLSVPPRIARPARSAPILPFETILLRCDAAKILSALPPHSARDLRALVRCADPFSSFEELQAELDGLSLGRILQLAAHLEQWGFVEIIAPLAVYTILAIAVQQGDVVDVQTAHKYEWAFPECGETLAAALARFNRRRTLGELVASTAESGGGGGARGGGSGDGSVGIPAAERARQLDRVGTVLWLLRHGCIEPIRTCVPLSSSRACSPLLQIRVR
jgi:hypothetical protein